MEITNLQNNKKPIPSVAVLCGLFKLFGSNLYSLCIWLNIHLLTFDQFNWVIPSYKRNTKQIILVGGLCCLRLVKYMILAKSYIFQRLQSGKYFNIPKQTVCIVPEEFLRSGSNSRLHLKIKYHVFGNQSFLKQKTRRLTLKPSTVVGFQPKYQKTINDLQPIAQSIPKVAERNFY